MRRSAHAVACQAICAIVAAACFAPVTRASAQDVGAFGADMVGAHATPAAGFAAGLFGEAPTDTFARRTAPVKPVAKTTARIVSKAVVDKPPVDTPPVDTLPVDTLPVDTSPVDTPPVDKPVPAAAMPPSRVSPPASSIATGSFGFGLFGSTAQAQTLPRPAPPPIPGVPSPPGPATPVRPTARPSAAAPAQPSRDLTPAEIGALQTLLVNRATGAMLTPGNADAVRRALQDTQRMLPATGTLDTVRPHPRRIDVDTQVLLAEPQTIQLALGVVTPITFLDSSGRPWPVEAVAFDPRMLAQDGNGCGANLPQSAVVGAGVRPSTITMMPCRINTFGNVSIKLEGYSLPVILMARSGGSDPIDLPVTVYVRGRSPVAPMLPAEAMAAYTPPPSRSAAAGRGRKGAPLPDRLLDTFGAGAPPANAQRVAINDPGVSGWLLDGKLYLRGAVTVINPAQDAVAESVGGIKVWRFDHPVPRILVVDEAGAERDLVVTF